MKIMRNKKMFLIIIIYLLCYGPVVVFFEFLSLGKLAYLLYEPIDYLSSKSNAIFHFYNGYYKGCGGKVDSQSRYFFPSSRTAYYSENQLIHKEVYYSFRSGTVESSKVFWNEILSREHFYNNEIERVKIYSQKDCIIELIFKSGLIEGELIKYTLTNNVFECTIKAGKPFNGQVISISPEYLLLEDDYPHYLSFDTGSVVYLVTYKNGEKVSIEKMALFGNGFLNSSSDFQINYQ